MKLAKEVTHIFDGALDLLAFLAAVLLVFMMLSVVAEVIMRYLLAYPLIWVIEVAEYCLLFITFLGAAWLLRSEGHVKMDLVINQLNPRVRAFLNTVNSITGAIICLTVTCFGVWVTWDVLHAGYKMPTELEPPQFLILLIIPVGSFLLFVQFLRRTYKYLTIQRASLDKEQRR